MTTRTKGATEIDKIVGANIRAIRSLRKMSQEKLAEPLGLTFQQIQKYENGANRVGASRLHQIATILKAPIADFFARTPPTCEEETIIEGLMASEPGEVALLESFRAIPNADTRRALGETLRIVAEAHAKPAAGASPKRATNGTTPIAGITAQL